MRPIRLFPASTVAIAVLSGTAVVGLRAQPPAAAAPAAGPRLVAIGCLTRQGSAAAPRYILTDRRGEQPTVYRLEGSGADLARHVGHVVEVAGPQRAGTAATPTLMVRTIVWIAARCT